jgi:hypothetical protein
MCAAWRLSPRCEAALQRGWVTRYRKGKLLHVWKDESWPSFLSVASMNRELAFNGRCAAGCMAGSAVPFLPVAGKKCETCSVIFVSNIYEQSNTYRHL